MKQTWFEKAIFLSWYCSKGDCTFCFMSTQKDKISEPRLARRTTASILSEIFIAKKMGWKINFLSSGYHSHTIAEMEKLLQHIRKIYSAEIILNIGHLNDEKIQRYLPYIDGICGSLETINREVHKKVCPSKSIVDIEKMFTIANNYPQLKRVITIVLGLGETIDDFPLLQQFIKKYRIDRVTYYRLKRHPGTPFEFAKEITTMYYVDWLRKTREAFPKIEITVGSWITHFDELHQLLQYADAITKFPSIRLFNSQYAKQIEHEAYKAGKTFQGSMTIDPQIDINEVDTLPLPDAIKDRMKILLEKYLHRMLAPIKQII